MEQPMSRLLEDGMRVRELDVGVEDDIGVDVELMADPADSYPVDPTDAGSGGEVGTDVGHQTGVDAVHQPPEDVAAGNAQHVDDGGADQESDDRIRALPTGERPGGGDDDGQAGEPVGAGVEPIGDEGGRADAAPDADAVAGDQFVAGEPDEPGCRDPAGTLDVAGVEQAFDRVPGSQSGGDRQLRPRS